MDTIWYKRTRHNNIFFASILWVWRCINFHIIGYEYVDIFEIIRKTSLPETIEVCHPIIIR